MFTLLATLASLAAAGTAPPPTPPPTPAPAPAPAPQLLRLDLPLERFTLANGLAVILQPDRRLPTVTVHLRFGVGSADERPGRTGFAHLFEHLMFMGTRSVPEGTFDRLIEAGGGQSNASTGREVTAYYEWGPSNLLETFLWLEADRLAHLADDMNQAKLDLQRDIVKNERRQSYETQPYGLQDLLVAKHLFPPTHPFHHPVIGSHEDLSAASVEDVKAFFRAWYVPANASLVLTGDFDATQARRLVEQHLGALPRVEPPRRALPVPVELLKAVRVVQPDVAQSPRVVFAWLAPAAYAPGETELELLEQALTTGKSARLVKTLVVEAQLAEEVHVEFERGQAQSVFSIVATAQAGRSVDALERALTAELQRLLVEPLTETEIRRARSFLVKDALTGLEQLLQRAHELNELQARFGDPGGVEYFALHRADTVGPSEVTETVRRVLGRPRLTLTFVPAKTKTEAKAKAKAATPTASRAASPTPTKETTR